MNTRSNTKIPAKTPANASANTTTHIPAKLKKTIKWDTKFNDKNTSLLADIVQLNKTTTEEKKEQPLIEEYKGEEYKGEKSWNYVFGDFYGLFEDKLNFNVEIQCIWGNIWNSAFGILYLLHYQHNSIYTNTFLNDEHLRMN